MRRLCYQLWSKEMPALWHIGHPNKYVWVLIDFFDTEDAASQAIKKRFETLDSNGSIQYAIEQWKIIVSETVHESR